MGSEVVGEVSKRVSPEERRVTVKPNGVVLRRDKMRSDSGSEMRNFFWCFGVDWGGIFGKERWPERM